MNGLKNYVDSGVQQDLSIVNAGGDELVCLRQLLGVMCQSLERYVYKLRHCYVHPVLRFITSLVG